jgi:hypothetical protein
MNERDFKAALESQPQWCRALLLDVRLRTLAGNEHAWEFYMCKSCLSGNQGAFNSEVCIHFPGLENLDKPAVFTFPKIVVCFDCGHAEFSMPENELPSLVEGRYLRLAENRLAKGDPSLGC